MAALYEAAKAEGQVEYWAPTNPRIIQEVIAAFNEQYPDIQVNHFEIRPGEAVPRALAEAEQQQVSFDIGEGRVNAINPLLEADLAQSYDDWTEVFGEGLPSEAVWDNGRLLVRTSLAYPIAYNTNLVEPEDLPTSWEDLLDPKWRGNILLESRGNAFAYLGLEWGEEKVLDYVRQIREQDPVFVRGGTATREQLSAGAAAIAVGAYLYVIADGKELGQPIDWVRASPMGAGTTMIYLMKDSPNPNAAKLFAGWLASQDGQDAILQTSYDVPLIHGKNPLIDELEANNIEVLYETMENFEVVEELSEKVGDALGAPE